MRWNLVGAFKRNHPFGTEIAFRKGLERLGEYVTILDPSYPDQELDDQSDVTVVFKWLDPGPYRDRLASLPGKKVVYQVDDLRFPHIKNMMVEMRKYCDHALTFDRDGAELALQYGYMSARRLLLTADNMLYRPISGIQKDIDVSFVGSLSNGPNHASRMRMLDIVSKMDGVKLVVANELFDIGKLCEIYNRSKIVLNHATDVGQPFGSGFGYQCRHFEAGFTKSFVFSNSISNDDALLNVAVFHDEYGLEHGIRGFLDPEEDGYRERVAQALYDELYEAHLPEHRAQEMVEFVKGIM